MLYFIYIINLRIIIIWIYVIEELNIIMVCANIKVKNMVQIYGGSDGKEIWFNRR